MVTTVDGVRSARPVEAARDEIVTNSVLEEKVRWYKVLDDMNAAPNVAIVSGNLVSAF
jgi:hypothetical protein